MKKVIALVVSIAVISVLVLTFLVVLIPAKVGGWVATYPVDAGADAREIAAALSTPPTHLAQPMQFALYHWQTLIAGVLAFWGGLAAFLAAFVGAQALREQTNRMAHVTREAAQQNLYAIQLQLEAQERRDVRTRQFELQQLASAFHAEISSIHGQAKEKAAIKMFERAGVSLDEFKKFLDVVFTDTGRPEVYDSLRDKIGCFPNDTPTKIVKFYDSVQGLSLSIHNIKSGSVTISSEDLARSASKVLHKREQQVVLYGEDVLQDLEKLRGAKKPEVFRNRSTARGRRSRKFDEGVS
ncbi:hypothetical protein [Azospirillum brasilense]|uniref:hypothetical protein n=1 Tax=Azospirillum brasilense TaxID=192 RepID=UPI00117776F2|nr:hypothetical protein [Azospirillum brasilense]